MYRQESLWFNTQGRGTHEISGRINAIVSGCGLSVGLCHIFIHHTSASLIICENADPLVREDLERFMAAKVPDGDPMFEHHSEGPDDMPAHVRSVLTATELTIPISEGRCALGTWQGIYLWEHRSSPHRRMLTITVSGE
ncbi:MAG: secondary thiamine-phosphate synthase enzyme YjbQ [Pseudomonadota bacterium]